MIQPRPRPQLGRSLLAVFAGVLAGVALTLAADSLMRLAGQLPPLGQRATDASLAVAILYRTLLGVFAAWLTARLAPYLPLRHALVGGGLGFAVSLAGALATWNAGPAYGPHWYPVALVLLALPQAWLGGWIVERHAGR
jgi:hypothetical protein